MAEEYSTERRKMISDTVKTAMGAMILSSPLAGLATVNNSASPATVGEIMNLIYKEIPGAPFPQTVDTLKSGDASLEVTGIISTMFATIPVIQQAVLKKANFIIAHEPTFYNHTDDINWSGKNEIVEKKMELLRKNKIAVWRFHDYWHAHRPDGVRKGVVLKMGWAQYDPQSSGIISIPETGLSALIQEFKKNLGINHLRVIGNMGQRCKRIALLPGAAGGQSQLRMAEELQPDVLVVGEVHEWETAEYIRDARALGKKISLIVLGHSVSEEPGMDWLVSWLQPKIPGIPVTHIPATDPFQWL